MSRATPAQLSQLAKFASCEIADALIKLKVPHGGYLPDLEMFSKNNQERGTVIGEAFTVKMVDAKDTEAPKLSGHFVDLAPPGSIIIISTPPQVKSASFGGLLGTAASVKGVRGVIVDGRCRDLSELRSLGLPVFARGHSILGQSPFTRPSAVQIPLRIQPASASMLPTSFPTLEVHPFDVILADEDGVVVISPDVVETVIQLVIEGKRVDELCRVDLLHGRGIAETFAHHRGTK